MNEWAFAAEVVKALASLAWPLAVLGCVWIFRREIAPLLPLFHVKHKDTEIGFRLDEAEAIAEDVVTAKEATVEGEATGPGLPPPVALEHARFRSLTELSPVAAMVEIRRDLETALKELYASLGSDPARQINLPAATVAKGLHSDGFLDPTEYKLVSEVLHIGNLAAHSKQQSVSIEEVLRYRELANQVIASLREQAARFAGTGR